MSRLPVRMAVLYKATALIALPLAAAFAPAALSAQGSPSAVPPLALAPAAHRPGAASSSMLAAARAGRRLVAVGERGTVLLSDDGGLSFRQADKVPVSSTLTGVSFVDDHVGWAVGHAGVVLHSVDGGSTWDLQRSDLEHDQPLLSVYFFDASRGVAVGLWSLILVTGDGGKSWQTVPLPKPQGAARADLNLYGLFAGPKGEIYASAEQGKLLRSGDGGLNWAVLETGYRGSLWTGAVLADGTLLVGGLRGTLLRSADAGATWKSLNSTTRSSITGIVQAADGRVIASALDGIMLTSPDGLTFNATQSEDRVAYTAVVVSLAGKPVLMSRNGPKTTP